MGHVKVDIAKDARNYMQQYALNDAAGVKALLRDRHRIAARRFRGDTAASDIIIDLHSAIETSGMTARQTEAIALVYGMDLTQEAAASVMGIRQDSVKDLIAEGVERIAAVYQRWDYGDIAVTFDTEGTTTDGL